MSLSSYIDNLRERPEHVRRRFAFGWSFGITAVIFTFWVASFTNIGIGAKSTAQKAVAATAEKIITPGESLLAGAGDLFNTIWSKIVKPKKVEFAEVQVLPGKR